jgi:hypothetical protein
LTPPQSRTASQRAAAAEAAEAEILPLETHMAYVNTTPAAIAVAPRGCQRRLPTAVANGGRGGSRFGAPRYGVKPKVMLSIPKPTIT